jgi:flagellar motor switch protein FliM
MNDLIRRKIDQARPAEAEGAPGADRGWRLALARAARDAMGLDAAFRELTVSRQSLAEVLELAPDRALLALLDGPMGGLGVMMLDPVVTATLIEMQTLGRLSPQTPPPRKASRIDAAMVAGVIDRALAGLDQALADEADLIWAGGFRYASYLEDARPLGLMLEDEPYRVLSGDVVFGGSARSGRVTLVLPAEGRGDRPALQPDAAEAEAPQFTAALNAMVLQADCRLDAVIARLTLPLRQIMALAPGEVLALPSASVDRVALDTIEGQRVAGARLGQHRGMRAVKLSEAPAARQAPLPLATVPATLRQNAAPALEEVPQDLRAAG